MKGTAVSILDKILDFIERHYYIFLTLILSITLFNLFYYLKETPIYSWDEARHGISAYEMLKNNEYIVNTYGYKNDYWNLKPPMSFWAIMLGYKIAGFNPLGLRLLSALAAFLTILSAAFLVKHKYGGVSSLVCALILTTSPKYIVIHNARTGDADSLFVFFFTLAMISMILIEENRKFLYLAGLCFSFAFLTKSWHALNIAAIGFFYLLFTKLIFKLKLKEWLLFITSAFLPIFLWGILRYRKDGSEFIRMMIEYDLLARSSTTLEGHIGDKWYYFKTVSSFYSLWLALLGICITIYLIQDVYSICIKRLKDKITTRDIKENNRSFAGIRDKMLNSLNKNILKHNKGISLFKRNYALALLLWVTIPLLAYTKASTKIGWYILPVYIPIAIAIGSFSGVLMRGPRKNQLAQLLIIISLIVGVAAYEPVIIDHIVRFKNDNKRVNVRNCEVTEDIRGANTYVYYGANAKINVGPLSELKDWEQSDLLSIEFYWDLIPKDGGFHGFLKDTDKPIIIVPKRSEFIPVVKEHNLKVLSNSDYIYILRKQ